MSDGLKYKTSFKDDTKYKSDTLQKAPICGFLMHSRGKAWLPNTQAMTELP